MKLRGMVAVGALGALLASSAAWAAKDDTDVVQLAEQKFDEVRATGVDMQKGPCLGEIKPGWVADVAHNPRQPVDDRPENQCPAFRSGQAKHFVELDPNGNLIRSR